MKTTMTIEVKMVATRIVTHFPLERMRPTWSAAAGAAAGPAVDAAQRTLRQRAGCRCKAGTCADDLDYGDVDMIRAVNASMQKTELDLLILGKILTVISRGATTSKSKTRVQTARKRTRCNYTHEGNSMECSYRPLF